ncbi:MAG: hypothetical protein VX460_14690 [Planctomycetota bacterium]|nr:hypothetical protein [Planctomycetota bacterium]
MRASTLITAALFSIASCKSHVDPPEDPLASPVLVASIDTLTRLSESYDVTNPQHPGPAAVQGVSDAIQAGGDALEQAALAACGDVDPRRRLRA